MPPNVIPPKAVTSDCWSPSPRPSALAIGSVIVRLYGPRPRPPALAHVPLQPLETRAEGLGQQFSVRFLGGKGLAP